jgi:trans-2-enoyl-CoA reductase
MATNWPTSVQVDDTVTPMSTDEWSAWIDAQVGTDKPEEEVE